MAPSCRIGTSGWDYPHWRGVFYPAKLPAARRFAHYAASFPTVEVNYSFYRLPDAEAFERWRDQAPPGFVYAVKANRYITHVKRLKDCAEPLARFLDRARRLEDRLGPVLYQLPPKWKANPDRLAAFAALLPGDLTHVFEFRDARWFVESVREILVEHSLAFCIHDMPDVDCPDWTTAPVVYLRLHGGRGHCGDYGTGDLARLAHAIDGHLSAGREVFAYFNNDAEGNAVRNARDLAGMVRRA